MVELLDNDLADDDRAVPTQFAQKVGATGGSADPKAIRRGTFMAAMLPPSTPR